MSGRPNERISSSLQLQLRCCSNHRPCLPSRKKALLNGAAQQEPLPRFIVSAALRVRFKGNPLVLALTFFFLLDAVNLDVRSNLFDLALSRAGLDGEFWNRFWKPWLNLQEAQRKVWLAN